MTLTNEYDDPEDDDVVIEGGDLHKVLSDMGCTDFECTPVNRFELHDFSNEYVGSEDTSPKIKHEWLWSFIERIKRFWVHGSRMISSQGVGQAEIISRLDPLLEDHSVMIRNMLKNNDSSEGSRYTFARPTFIVTNSILATGTILYKPFKIPGFIAISSIMALIVFRTCKKSHSINNLKTLILIQNDTYYQYKRTLKILKNRFCLKLSHRQSQRTFSNLEIGRIKYLQPMCEDLMQSMEEITRTCYEISLLLMNFVCEPYVNNFVGNLVTKFDDTTFVINGDVTYEKLKQHYYIYILVQSEMMHILAILFQNESLDSHLYWRLMGIVNSLQQFFKKRKIKLSNVIEQYKSFRAPTIHHELKNTVETKLQDLYMHVDLLARKIHSAYNVVESIIDDIDNCRNDESSIEIIGAMIGKMNEAYKEIDTARNFAEFNNLLLGKFRQNQSLKIGIPLNPTIVDKIGKILPIVHDTDPQIIDEVFEEYIKDEYLKPLYEDNDIDSSERSKLDELLAKNFMCELKEVLIDKYKSMSEREARALSCYRKKMHITEQDVVVTNYEERVPVNNPMPPPPPPLPLSVIHESSSQSEQIKVRAPVPLPRSINATFSPTARRRRKIDRELVPQMLEANGIFLTNVNMDIRRIRLPAFTSDEETFIGSGENSDEELLMVDQETDILDDVHE